MANQEKGEVAHEIGGVSYTFCLDFDALEAAQETLSKPGHIADLAGIFDGLKQKSLKHGRVLFWASLQRYHPDVTMERAKALLNDVGGFAFMWGLLHEIANVAMPTEQDAKELALVNPLKARARKSRRRSAGATSALAKSA